MAGLKAARKANWKDDFSHDIPPSQTTMPKPRFFTNEEIAKMESTPGAYPPRTFWKEDIPAEAYMDTVTALKSILRVSERELRDCVNELCDKCGRCRNEHLGACKDCKWWPIRNGGVQCDAGRTEGP